MNDKNSWSSFIKGFTITGVFLIIVSLALVNQNDLNTNIHQATTQAITPSLKSAIQKGFQKGEVDLLFPHFDEIISICIADEEQIYMAYHAQAALQNFFNANPPAKFEISHTGKSKGGNETYFIGDYTDVNDQKMRIYIFVIANLIQEIEISSETISS